MQGRQQSNGARGNGHNKQASATQAGPLLSIDQAREEIAYVLAVEAYLWGYPLYSNLVATAESLRAGEAGFNSLHKVTQLASASQRRTIAPADVTVDAHAVFDVSFEPVVLHVPRLDPPRWYLAQVTDMFGEACAAIGGIKGTAPGDYVIVGPDFIGPVPGEMTRIASSTRMGRVHVQLFVAGADDLDDALEGLRGFAVVPLSTYESNGLTPQPAPTPPPFELGATAPEELRHFELLGQAMRTYLPASTGSGDTLVGALRGVGLTLTGGFDWAALDAATRRGLVRAELAGEQIVDQAWRSLAETNDGWRYLRISGRFGHNIARRAALAKYMRGGVLASEVLHATARADHTEAPLSGTNRYVLRFEPRQQPPVTTLWNVALYGDDMRFADNELGRFSIGSTTPSLTPDETGALTILIQQERPSDTSNWLPAPAGNFNLTMRLYGPGPRLLDGSYRLPPVTRVM